MATPIPNPPTHGWTRLGHPVHAKTVDHLPNGTPYQRFNKKVALWLVNNIGTMTCFWIIFLMCLAALPAVLHQMNIISTSTAIFSYGFYLLLTWMISTTFQAILLPGLMVGQNLQNEAGDARSAKTFEDTEKVIGLLDINTQGGLKDLADHIDQKFASLTLSSASDESTAAPKATTKESGKK